MDKCKINGCNNPIKSRELCSSHYMIMWRREHQKLSEPLVTKERVLSDTIDMGDTVKAPLYNKRRELVGHTILNKDIYTKKYFGKRIRKTHYGYAAINKDFVHHGVIGKPKDRWIFVDHINRNRLDNRRENLRFVTPLENGRNSRNCVGGTGPSGIKGIHYIKGEIHHKSPWQAVAWYGGEYGKGRRKIKMCKTIEEAQQFLDDFYSNLFS